MYKGKRFLCIIPARSGSKGIVNKNIKELLGKPLMAYTIESAKKSGVFDNIILSTDSKEYGNIGKLYGANVPFIRGEELSLDTSSTNAVVFDVLEKLKALGEEYDYFIVLQPTSPLRNEKHIIESLDILISNNGNSLVSVCEQEHSSNIFIKINEDGTLNNSF
ncbi:MAG: cytidylyltransferase domain-containing protein, partial [Clostridium sp.]